jgi:hypothetical protein
VALGWAEVELLDIIERRLESTDSIVGGPNIVLSRFTENYLAEFQFMPLAALATIYSSVRRSPTK